MKNIILFSFAIILSLFCLVHYAVPSLIKTQGQKISCWIYFGVVMGNLLFSNGFFMISVYQLANK